MQDYPQHLFISKILATYNDPAYDWHTNYTVDLRPTPYSLSYIFKNLIARIVGLETAGRIFLSLYLGLTALLVVLLQKRHGTTGEPWPLLLLFPFLFNQIYYLGFENYLISIPILFLCNEHLDRFADKKISAKSIAIHSLLLIFLFAAHPYTLLVYIVFCLATASLRLPDRGAFWRAIAPATILCAIFIAWYLNSSAKLDPFRYADYGLWWWPGGNSSLFYLLPFTGMRITEGVNWVVMTTWTLLFAVILFKGIQRKEWFSFPLKEVRLFLLTLIGYVGLPYWAGYYGYFNLRLAPISYILLCIILSRIPLRKSQGIILTVLAAFLVVSSMNLGRAVSSETEEILPVLKKMEPNALILPVLFDVSSTELDPSFFYQFHSHDHNYYHVLVGGGANPYLFPNPMMPVQFQKYVTLPFPATPEKFTWESQGVNYRYILTRGSSQDFTDNLQKESRLILRSGKWTLFEHPLGYQSP
ncbi:hypothetical protein K0B90_09180 [bacterium]|nr:hypothetical protein [bacterium]